MARIVSIGLLPEGARPLTVTGYNDVRLPLGSLLEVLTNRRTGDGVTGEVVGVLPNGVYVLALGEAEVTTPGEREFTRYGIARPVRALS